MCENIPLFYRVSISVCHSGPTVFATTVTTVPSARSPQSRGWKRSTNQPLTRRPSPFSPTFAWYPCLDPCAEFGACLGFDSYNDRFTSASPTPPNQTKKVPRLPRSRLKSRTRLVSSAYDSLWRRCRAMRSINVNRDVRTRTVT